MKRRLIALTAATVIAGGVRAQESSPTPVVRHCISVARIKRTEVVSDRIILFHMLGRRIFKNELLKSCFGLGFDRGFAYAPSADQLCNVDVIRVVGSGAICPLGKFELYERPAAQENRSPTSADEQQGGAAE